MLRHLLRQALEAHGHHITEAEHGRGMMRLWEQGRYEILITDTQMPFAGGPEMIRTIRQNHPDAKVIAMSADPSIRGSLPRSALTAPQFSFTKTVSLVPLQAAIEQLELAGAKSAH